MNAPRSVLPGPSGPLTASLLRDRIKKNGFVVCDRRPFFARIPSMFTTHSCARWRATRGKSSARSQVLAVLVLLYCRTVPLCCFCFCLRVSFVCTCVCVCPLSSHTLWVAEMLALFNGSLCPCCLGARVVVVVVSLFLSTFPAGGCMYMYLFCTISCRLMGDLPPEQTKQASN